MFREFTVIRFTANGREYDVDERLVNLDRTAPSRTDAGVQHIYLTDDTHFRATNVRRITLYRQIREAGN
ncbi:hypothetical protein [Escherichia albertii]|uniref:hypothetical protein n=1 Tax=Escherichia albertii TaxID=208962 RepID=UPI000BFA4983|nr:hypothetical protein [Escherichia albertii]PFF94824.1 hypothetical protein CRH02_16520 [Escherichia albertii]